jgi:asparagine synthetase B (glutamine-hydrolysing)
VRQVAKRGLYIYYLKIVFTWIGPDYQSSFESIVFPDVDSPFFSSVLSLRGIQPTPQPLAMSGFKFWYNGEIYSGLDIPLNKNDGYILFERLVRELHGIETASQRVSRLSRVLKSVHGEWAMVLFDPVSSHLIFGRDILGRRSLLWHLPMNSESTSSIENYFILSSVGVTCLDSNDFWEEVPANGLFHCSLDDLHSEVCLFF